MGIFETMANGELIFPLLSGFFAGLCMVYAKYMLGKISISTFVVVNFLIISALATPIAFFSFEFTITIMTIFLVIIIIVSDFGVNYFLFYSIKKDQITKIGPLFSTSALFAIIFSFMILPSETENYKILVASLAIMISVFLLMVDKWSKNTFKSMLRDKGYFVICSAILAGLAAVLSKIVIVEYGTINPETLYWFRTTIVMVIFLIILKPVMKEIDVKNISHISIRGIFVISQWMLLLYSIATYNVILTIALANTSPIFLLILGKFLFKETITWKKILPIPIIILAIIYMQF